MRIIRDFKMPNLKFKKIEMNDIPNVEDVKVDYSKVMDTIKLARQGEQIQPLLVWQI